MTETVAVTGGNGRVGRTDDGPVLDPSPALCRPSIRGRRWTAASEPIPQYDGHLN